MNVGLILCGGKGKRLQPLTNRRPKSLLELKKGYTILDKQLLDLKYADVKHVILLTGYLHDRIEARYGSSWNGLEVAYSREEKPLGTWGAIAQALKTHQPKATLVVMNGDIITDVNLKEMLIENREYAPHPVTMFTTYLRSPYGIVDVSGKMVYQFREKPTLPYMINAGVYVVREGFDFLGFVGALETPSDIERDVFPKLARAGLIGNYIEPDPEVLWKSVDSMKDLEEVVAEFANREDKPWGFEKTITRRGKYIFKKLFIKRGYRTSLHSHSEEETLHLSKGTLNVADLHGNMKQLKVNETVTIEAKEVHSLVAVDTCFIEEVSSRRLDDIQRMKDYYGRM